MTKQELEEKIIQLEEEIKIHITEKETLASANSDANSKLININNELEKVKKEFIKNQNNSLNSSTNELQQKLKASYEAELIRKTQLEKLIKYTSNVLNIREAQSNNDVEFFNLLVHEISNTFKKGE